ncbi:BN860_13278g1_1 [Zygosaccharomyces bailii CLIB 213]|uniref:Protein-serine/threonine kinase n=1 Tax=Zygosaccharomyces bailii (strain CLIB 213 / ATCC 58445 / CBS 680 / BCRC 21525 / NBRC 1098 / NCYC 1416 / NRRL Y-2227) TaxID=1333698 RepID=A0A8J2X6J3_ZYGB2|nr:BN860_13278g1_1 [Zygosaccharomyces bailii CLIB 213]
MRQLSCCCRQLRNPVASFDISRIPNFTKYSAVKPINEDLAPHVCETMKAFPSRSKHVNQQHYYHNWDVLIKSYAQRKPHPMSLTQLAQYYDDSTKLTKQKIINSGKFVKEELAIRMAQKLKLLQQLPFCVVNNFHFVQVYESYYNIFERFRKFPQIRTLEDNSKFAEFSTSILRDFNTLNLPHLVMGALECTVLDLYPQDKMDELLSDLMRARISRRLIVEEHVSITQNYLSGKKENKLVLGDIFQQCSAKDYIIDASQLCQKFIRDMYFDNIALPELIIDGEVNLKFYFLPIHLRYLLYEILRNAYEATMKEYIRRGLQKPEAITVTVIENSQSFLFRISDRAGGFPYNDRNIWSFGKSKEKARESLANFHKLPGLQTVSIYDQLESDLAVPSVNKPYLNTSLDPIDHSSLTGQEFKFEKPLMKLLERSHRYKLGVGLAMCKVYADYWNGDLALHSIQGYGTDVVLKLGNLMNNVSKLQLDRV